MVTYGFKKMLAEAAAVVESVSVSEAIPAMNLRHVVFIDVRDADERRLAGRLPAAVHASRGLLEFMADPEGPLHNEVFASDNKLILFCATGGRSMLAAKTLRDMGIENVATLTGGFAAWKEAGAPVEPG